MTLVSLLGIQVFWWLRKSRSFHLIRGVLLLLAVYGLSHFLGLHLLKWVLGKFSTALLILLIIIFQPELRRLLDQIGSGHAIRRWFIPPDVPVASVIKSLLSAVESMARHKVGALLVIEMNSILSEYIQSGIQMNALVSAELLITLFHPNTPTHDGAVIIRGNTIASAGCLLPLTHSRSTDRRLGTRHHAAIGLTELTDAVVIVISEENGVISLAEDGSLTRYLNKEALETRLFELLKPDLG